MTYVPTQQDLDWTQKAIQGKQAWAVPSGGFILSFNHDMMGFTTFMKMEPRTQEVELFDRVFLNMIILGYKEENRIMCEGADSVDDIMVNVFEWTEDEVERAKIRSLQERPDDPRFDNE